MIVPERSDLFKENDDMRDKVLKLQQKNAAKEQKLTAIKSQITK